MLAAAGCGAEGAAREKAAKQRDEKDVYPGATWERRSPAEAGLDGAKLDELARLAGGRGCVVRGGYMVYTWGDPSRRGDVASACKPWFSHFLFVALEEGKIASLDEKVARWEPRLAGLSAALGHKDRGITWRHLANQISCYGLAEKPGTAFAYNDWQMALFFDTLFLKVYGASFETIDEEIVSARLTGILECEDRPTFLAFGRKDRPGRVGVSVRDFARFGLLYLREGRWKDRQLIRPEHARMAVHSPLPNSIPRAGAKAAEMIPGQRTLGSREIPDNQTDHMGSYSWLWWTNGVDRDGKRHWPDVPEDAYGAFGHGGLRAMVVLPGLDLIVSWNDTRIDSRELENRALATLARAVVDRRSDGETSRSAR
ncbi:MAG: serine hydrolase [Planctomycetes bacterium]|nr:serine hydrolase [Planctomycetota bacterium]